MSFRQRIAKLSRRLQNSAALSTKRDNSKKNPARLKVSNAYEVGNYRQSKRHSEAIQWAFLSGQAAIFLGIHSSVSLAEYNNDTSVPGAIGLQKVEDASVISNEHTSKWRIFTDNGRDFFMKGNIAQAEKFFRSALQEAKEGFGERDPHVASACNNLAELYRIQKAYDDAEPLYMEGIKILEEYFGTNDVRVGAALHNLGQFYLVQRKLEKARACYERALKIKRRVLGEIHPEYADTMYYLGNVLHLQGNEMESADLIKESIQILEAVEQGESIKCIRRMQYLAQIYAKSNRSTEAELILRKVLHVVELSKGSQSLDTVLATERLALTIQRVGKLKEAEELLETCLEIRKSLLPDVHIQNAANMLNIARVKIDISNQLMRTDSSQAMAELDLAKNLLRNSIRVGRQVLDKSIKQKGSKQPIRVPGRIQKECHSTALILLQAMNSLGSLERMKLENSKECDITEADAVLRQCMSTYKEFEKEKSISDSPEIMAEYLSCLWCLHGVVSEGKAKDSAGVIEDIEDEIRRVEGEASKT